MIAESERQGALTDFKRKTKELIAQQRAFADKLEREEVVEAVARELHDAKIRSCWMKSAWDERRAKEPPFSRSSRRILLISLKSIRDQC